MIGFLALTILFGMGKMGASALIYLMSAVVFCGSLYTLWILPRPFTHNLIATLASIKGIFCKNGQAQ